VNTNNDKDIQISRRSPIKSIRVLDREPGGELRTSAVYERPRRRVSKQYRGIEKFVRRFAEANRDASEIYLERHKRSNEKKKDGWLKQLSTNSQKARRKGWKKLQLHLR
jgi:hypothetical protein